MYLRTVKRKRKDGSSVEYVQLAHNHRDPKTGLPRAEVLYTFGRKEDLDLDALRRLVKSISRFLEPEDVEQIQKQLGEEWPFEFLGSRQLGGSWFLDRLWHKLGIRSALEHLLKSRNYHRPIKRLIFTMVANRALNPSSKLAMESWVANEVLIDGLPEVEVHQLYQAMDFLLESSCEIQHDVFFSVANLFNLEVYILFLNTTTTYFEIEGEDEDIYGENGEVLEEGLRKRSKNDKDNHLELAHVVVAFAVTRTGIPVRCWVWPGNASDQDLVEEVKRDLNGWRLGRVILVVDAGFNSERNRRIMQGAGGHYIVGEKLRQGRDGLPVDALKRPGTYRTLENGLKIKEVIIDNGEARRRFVVVVNPNSTEDVVMGYKQLAQIERVFRGLKHTIDIRPIFHRLPDRIKAHVLLCWLAMVLIRIAEQETDETWQNILSTLQPLQMG
ncbi:MAG: transposase, partial [Firmicutes bacterium]|nr:transposase [Bacillota bacterium]